MTIAELEAFNLIYIFIFESKLNDLRIQLSCVKILYGLSAAVNKYYDFGLFPYFCIITQ